MTPIPEDLYKKIVFMSNEVKVELRRKGIVVPVDNKNGTISLGNFTVAKNQHDLYYIVNQRNELIVDNINLPQSAAMIANDLALGKMLNRIMLQRDKDYGYALFEELLHKKAVKGSSIKDLDYFDLMMTKCLISRSKKELHRNAIIKSFEKLRKLA